MDRLTAIKRKFRILERDVLLLIAFPLPVFALVYLYTTSDTMSINVPDLPGFLNFFVLGVASALLLFQYNGFRNSMKKLRQGSKNLEEKMSEYAKATLTRFWLLFWVGIICADGLLFYYNPVFTVLYAVNLMFVSLGKPTPDRIVKSLNLKGEEKDMVFEINRRD
jgi:hypothetical protein